MLDKNISNFSQEPPPYPDNSVGQQPSTNQHAPSPGILSKFVLIKRLPLKVLLAIVFALLIGGLLIFLIQKLRLSNNPLSSEGGEIVWWGFQHDGSVYAALIEEFEKKNPSVKIVYKKQSSQDYRERLTNSLAQGLGPDIFEIHNTWPAMFKNELSTLPASVMSKEEFTKSFYPVIATDLILEKGVVAMPLEYDALTLFINDDIFAAAAKRPPEKWDELRDLAPQLTQIGKEGLITQAGVAMGITENVDHWPEIFGLMFYQNRVNPAKPSGDLAKDVFSFYNVFRKNRVWDKTLPDSTTTFAKGKLAMYFGPSKRAREVVRINPNLRFRTVRLPQLPKNNPTDPDFSYATYWVQGVWERGKNKEAAWKFLKFLATKESLQKLNENIAKTETFATVYPRPEMNLSLREDPVLGSIVSLAPSAKSWYLAGGTNDGATGINSQIGRLYETLINTHDINDKSLSKLAYDIAQVLSKYGVSSR